MSTWFDMFKSQIFPSQARVNAPIPSGKASPVEEYRTQPTEAVEEEEKRMFGFFKKKNKEEKSAEQDRQIEKDRIEDIKKSTEELKEIAKEFKQLNGQNKSSGLVVADRTGKIVSTAQNFVPKATAKPEDYTEDKLTVIRRAAPRTVDLSFSERDLSKPRQKYELKKTTYYTDATVPILQAKPTITPVVQPIQSNRYYDVGYSTGKVVKRSFPVVGKTAKFAGKLAVAVPAGLAEGTIKTVRASKAPTFLAAKRLEQKFLAGRGQISKPLFRSLDDDERELLGRSRKSPFSERDYAALALGIPSEAQARLTETQRAEIDARLAEINKEFATLGNDNSDIARFKKDRLSQEAESLTSKRVELMLAGYKVPVEIRSAALKQVLPTVQQSTDQSLRAKELQIQAAQQKLQEQNKKKIGWRNPTTGTNLESKSGSVWPLGNPFAIDDSRRKPGRPKGSKNKGNAPSVELEA